MTGKQKHKYYLTKYSSLIKDLDGVFVECGVKYGTSAILLAKNINKTGYLFDTWNRFEGLSLEDGSERRIKKMRRRSSKKLKNLCSQAIKKNGVGNLCQMIQGNVLKTVPKFVADNSSTKIVFLHLDLDVYFPTKICLELFWDQIIPGGIVFVHDYGSRKWKGIKKCIDEFCDPRSIEINKLDIEACFFIK